MFPDSEPPYRRWLVFVGMVRWIVPVAGNGYFIDRNADTTLPRGPDELTRACHRYVGVVAEQFHAADRAIVLRDRFGDPKDLGRFQNRLEQDPYAKVREDLVWIEGNMRVVGNATLAGGQLLFRDQVGAEQGTPLYMQRLGDNPVSLAPGNRELRIVIGPDAQLDNRLLVGPKVGATDAKPAFVVQSDGKVGVNTKTPSAALLEVVADAAGTGLLQATVPGSPPNAAFVVNAAGDVGIGMGTSAPQAKLDIRKLRVTSGGSPLGQDKWVQIGNDRPDGDDGKVWIEYGPQAAPLLVLSDRDDPPRIQLQQIGTQAEASPEHSSWIGHAQPNSNALAVMGTAAEPTRIGINIPAPTEAVDVAGKVKFRPAGTPYDLLAAGVSQALIIVIGRVASTGAKAGGDRFTSASLGTGRYRITFTPALPAEPVVVLTPITPQGDDTLLSLRAVSPSAFEVFGADVERGADTGTAEDTAFMFMAICSVP